MNIAIEDTDGKVYCRPDTTLEKENRDLYAPQFVKGYHFAPVLFARVSKAGKCVARKFASRYYDSVGYGILLYVSNLMEDGIAMASCADHLSFLPFPMFNRYTLENGQFIFRKGSQELFCTSEGSETILEKAIADITQIVSIRIGDLIAIELARPQVLVSREEGSVPVSAEYCGNSTFDFNIIF